MRKFSDAGTRVRPAQDGDQGKVQPPLRHTNRYGTYCLLPAQGRGDTQSASVFHLATYAIPDGRSWCLSVMHGTANPNMLAGVVRQHSLAARARAASAACHRFIGEALSYVRSRPKGSRPEYGDDLDGYHEDVVEEIRLALERALGESDPYRAAKVFEHATPYLQGDMELVHMMEGILPPFEADLSRLEHHAALADEMEAETRAKSHFMSRLVYVWKGESARPGV